VRMGAVPLGSSDAFGTSGGVRPSAAIDVAAARTSPVPPLRVGGVTQLVPADLGRSDFCSTTAASGGPVGIVTGGVRLGGTGRSADPESSSVVLRRLD